MNGKVISIWRWRCLHFLKKINMCRRIRLICPIKDARSQRHKTLLYPRDYAVHQRVISILIAIRFTRQRTAWRGRPFPGTCETCAAAHCMHSVKWVDSVCRCNTVRVWIGLPDREVKNEYFHIQNPFLIELFYNDSKVPKGTSKYLGHV